MRIVEITSAGIVAVLLGIAAPVYAQQHDQKNEKQDRPQERQAQHEQARPEQRHAQQQRQPEQKQQKRAQQQERNDRSQHAQQPSRRNAESQDRARQQRQDRSQAAQQQRSVGRRTPQQQRVQQSAWQRRGSQHWESEHRTWQQRGGYHGYRIPDDRFRGYFGSNHGFHIYGLPFLVVGGYPRFQYQGYWFSPVDPWPEYWGNNWYDKDEVYVVYADNGYYMYNRRYPTVGIAINISM